VQRPGLPNEELQAWTGQRSAPVVAWNDERPRTGWSEIILLAALIEPLPHELCPMLPMFRSLYTLHDEELRARVDPILMEHRERMYRDHLQLPIQVA
jgi:hypothetical protein